METTVLRREDMLKMLMKMESQLEQLDHSIVSNISQQNQRWEREQEARLDSCMRQMENIERKITSNQVRNEINTASFRLKLSC